MDTRMSPEQAEVYPLAGMVVCADCGAAMVRKNACAGKKKYRYYVCSRNKETKECASHRIAVEKLEEAVLKVLKVQIANVLDLKQTMEKVSKTPFQELDIRELEKRIEQKEAEIARCRELRNMLYEDMKDGIVSKEDYMELHEAYTQRRDMAEDAIEKMKREIRDILASNTDKYQWLDYFAEYRNIDRLTRNVSVELIDRVKVVDKNTIEVVFSFEDCYREILANLEHAGCTAVCDSKGRIRFVWEEAV